MKYINKAWSGLMALACVVSLTACQDDFNGHAPVFEAPVAQHQANMTLAELKSMYWSTENNYADTIGNIYNDIDEITGKVAEFPRNADGSRKRLAEDIYIKGRVCSNDYDGNIFKKLMIQDEEGDAVCFSIDAYSLYMNYRYGQEIVFRATGLCFGAYGGQHVIGVSEWYAQNKVWETGRMPLAYFKERVELNGYPEPSKVYVTKLNLSDLADYQSDLKKYENRLVEFDNVFFPAANGKLQLGRYEVSSTLREIKNDAGGSINLDTSGYASFWYELVPEGYLNVVGMLVYSSSKGFQLQLNDLKGLVTNPETPKGESWENPYTVDEVIEIENDGTTGMSGWVTGYIVGAVAPEVENVITSNSDIEWKADATLPGTVVIAPSPDVKDVASCIVVPLPQGSKMRDAVNLVDNPSNYGKQLWVKGEFGLYMQAWGVSASGSASDFKIEGADPDTPVTGDGSKEKPFSCAQIIAMAPQSTTEAVASGVWAEGYIVGYFENYAAHFEVSSSQAANILISDTPDASDASQCVCIQLLANTDVRAALNLKDNPGVLGKQVKVKGDVMKYNTLPGIKNTSEYEMDGSGTPDKPDVPDTPAGDGDGTEAKPFTCSQVRGFNPNSTTEAVKTGVWAQGYIVGYYENYAAHFEVSSSQAANILLSDNPKASDASECICIQLLANTDPRAALNLKDNPGVLGKQVKVKGDIMKYNTLPGIKNTTNYVLDGQSGPDVPDTPTGNVVYSGLSSNADGWTFDNVKIDQALSYIWQWSTQYNCLKGSSYLNKAYAGESVAYTKVDLTGRTGCYVNFQHCYRYGEDTQKSLTLVVRPAGGSASDWTALTIPNWNDGSKFSFTASGDISLAEYDGKAVEIGFRYTSTSSAAATWEIKDFKVLCK